MKKKILLPTDFSKNAWTAICYAIELYKSDECEFYLLNTFDVSGYALESMMVPEPGEKLYDAAKEKSEKGLGKTLERLAFRDEYPGHKFFAISQMNSLLEAIKDIVDKKDIEMIIMGTKGTGNQRDVIFGSNAISVMEKVRNCPVMMVPEETLYRKPREIVFPTDYKTHFKRRELQYLVEIAQRNNAAIRVLYITQDDTLSEEQKNNQDLLKEYFEEVPYTFHTLHNVDVAGGLSCFVESRDSDMITFVNHKHSFFGSVFSRPLVKNLGHHATVPVLALHDLKN
ncbi:universal stress protein [uncultured Aquimarina sp.]|uniref:universal stress protein n=1 Tax=uncultured Aquimarina sp. TaxID=575652 RepID=UPI002613C426|nr:universal stress protein [uncultured Aquimarina sp.]